MPTYVGTITFNPRSFQDQEPSTYKLTTTDPSQPVIYLVVGTLGNSLAVAQMVAGTGQVVTVVGDGPFVGSFQKPILQVTSITVGAPPPPPTSTAPPPAVTPPPATPPGPAVGQRITLVGFIRQPSVPAAGVTHTLIQPNGQRWLLSASGENEEELDEILEEDEDEQARVTGVIERYLQGLPVVRVFSADEADDDDENDTGNNNNNNRNNSRNSFAIVAPGNNRVSRAQIQAATLSLQLALRGTALTPAQAQQLLMLSIALWRQLGARGSTATPLQVLQLLIHRMQRPFFPL